MGMDRDAAPGRTEKIVPRVREVLGYGVEINADANGGFSAHRAVEVGRLLEAHGFHHFEEPCPYDEYANTKAVADALDIPVAGGEVESSPERLVDTVERRVVDIVQPDVGYLGGVTRVKRIAELAEARGMPCTPHCAYQSMHQVFVVHLAAAMPSMYQRQEWGIEPTHERLKWLYEPHLEMRGGAVEVPEGPGWGVEVSSEFLKAAGSRVTKVGEV
jgi:L-alanine-DL-glutamate epimerase-like enolase superfamily enzyme